MFHFVVVVVVWLAALKLCNPSVSLGFSVCSTGVTMTELFPDGVTTLDLSTDGVPVTSSNLITDEV